MQLILTAAGILVTILAVTALTRNFSVGGQLVNPARFLGCGILLIVHVPLVDWLRGTAAAWVGGSDLAGTQMLLEWAPVVAVLALYLILLPTGRELYSAYLLERYARGQGMLPGLPGRSRQD